MARRLVASSRIAATDLVVEVGPGLGALTAEVLATGARMQVIERDPERVRHLGARFVRELTTGQLQLISGDARSWRPAAVASPWRVLANPPFNLTAELVRGWLLDPGPAGSPIAIDLLLQREAAHKLSGSAEGQTRSSVLVRLAGGVGSMANVPRDAVAPPARVDMAWWCFRRREQAATPGDLRLVDRLLEQAFAGPHTVVDALRGLATAEQVRRQAGEHGYRPTDHPRQVSPLAWLDFARHLEMCGKLSQTAGPKERGSKRARVPVRRRKP